MRLPVRSLLPAGLVVVAAGVALNAGGVEAPGCAEAEAQSSGSVERRLECRAACLATSAVPSASVRRRGARLRFGFRRRGVRRVRVDLLRFARGRTVTRPRRVRSFGSRRSSFTTRVSVPAGVYVARFRAGRDARRVVLRSRGGRFSRRRPYVRPKSCDFLSAYRLSSPAFGGTSKRGLRIAYRLAEPARVSVVVRRGRTVVKRYATRRRGPGRTFRLRLRPDRRGAYRVSLVAKGARRTVRSTLGAQGL